MHFSKTYAQLLLSLPPDLRDNAIQYRQLKKLINQIVHELSSLGLSPTVLHELFEAPPSLYVDAKGKGKQKAAEIDSADQDTSAHATTNAAWAHLRVVYEFNEEEDRIEPRLRLWVDGTEKEWAGGLKVPVYEAKVVGEEDEVPEGEEQENATLLHSLADLSVSISGMDTPRSEDPVSPLSSPDSAPSPSPTSTTPHELIIPLPSDTQFFTLLSSAVSAVSAHLSTAHADFTQTLTQLSRAIGDSARPASASASRVLMVLGGVRPHSGVSEHAGSIRLGSVGMSKSDLYAWRQLFQLYTDTQIFESISELSRGERTVDEAQTRLTLFVDQVRKAGLEDKFRGRGSREALDTFLRMNVFILDVKKFSLANSEATRKILKKHTKRTSLPLPPPSSPQSSSLSLQSPNHTHLSLLLPLFSPSNATSLPRLLVQAIGTTLLPVVPHLDDYACLICTGLAFKPIRLACGHLFCVRCLVKMQKRGSGDCPMCRRDCVLVANRSNVDWALLNFMQDWFPLEAREKLKQNEKEAAEEQIREMGLDPDQGCVVV